jgi:RecA/RadA recombinase
MNSASEFLKKAGLKAQLMEDTEDNVSWIDTGCYMLNALCSGSIFGGVPANRITIIGGGPASGKTYFLLSIARHFQEMHDNGVVAHFETEGAVDKTLMSGRGLDLNRVLFHEPDTIEKFRAQSIKLLSAYMAVPDPDGKRFPLMMVLDSLSSLYTEKEKKEAEGETGVKDMTKPGLIRSTFHILTRTYLAGAGVPLIMSNHIYNSMDPYGDPVVFSGGLGAIYAASTAIALSKKKDRDKKNEVVGNIITATAKKARLGKENAKVDIKLSYSTGMDRHYGLIELGESAGVFTRSGSYYGMPDGSKHYASTIYAEPKRFFTPDIMQRLDEAARQKFKYGDFQDEVRSAGGESADGPDVGGAEA